MSNTFNFSRFAHYFKFDIQSAWRNAGVSFLVVSCMPVLFFFIYQFFSLVFSRALEPVHIPVIGFAYVMSMIIAVIMFPVRQYGKITEKRAGSNWLLLPASRLEKYLSMILLCCVVAPIVWIVVMGVSDVLLHIIFPQYWEFGLPRIASFFNSGFMAADNILPLPMPLYLYNNWCTNIMFFTLGAVIFRKNKVILTILSLFALGMVVSGLMVFIASSGLLPQPSVNIYPADIETQRAYAESVADNMRIFSHVMSAVEIIALYLGLYIRIKTIKH